jgi:hypothetical protein
MLVIVKFFVFFLNTFQEIPGKYIEKRRKYFLKNFFFENTFSWMILQIKFYKNVNLSVLHFDPEIRILETTEENTKIQEIRFLRDGAK